ncbi:MAG: glycosyl transferase [Burkholderiales bacterium]|nr:glycosyl transferase [Burkholderiales bacterium]
MFVLSILLAVSLSYAISGLAVRGIGVFAPLDVPNERSLHSRPVPRIGGAGIVAGMGASLVATNVLALPVALAFLLAAISLWDDWRPLPVVVRLAAHLAAAAVFCVTAIQISPIPTVLVVVAIAWMTNLYNFMDGSDGLAGGMATIGFGTYAAAAAVAGDHALLTVCACIAAAALAFLRFNFHPARVFMGDVGSIPLGFLGGALGAWGVVRDGWPAWFPIVVFAPFAADASLTLLRRLLRGERVWQAHRSHYYQRLVLMGWGHRRTALAEYALMAITCIAGFAALFLGAVGQVVVLSVLGLGYALLVVLVDRRWAAYSRCRTV